jgi:surfeit locus 1 family protein
MTARQGPGVVVTTLAVLICVAILCGLGVWQLQRKAWKENLISAMTERLDRAPQPLPPPAEWGKFSQDKDEFRRVHFAAEFAPGREALVYTPGSALRSDIKGPGYFVFAPARLTDGGVIVVDRGFVPMERKDAARSTPSGTIDVVGVLRWPETRGMFTPAEDVKGNVWFLRDPAAMSAKGGWGATAPFYVDQEAPVPPGGWPKPGKIEVHLRDDHLQYAITWFGLAAGLIGVYGWWLLGRIRQRDPLQPEG